MARNAILEDVHTLTATSDPVCLFCSPPKSTIRVVLGQHFFNKTTDVAQEFEVEKYIRFPDYTVYNPTENDIGEPFFLFLALFQASSCQSFSQEYIASFYSTIRNRTYITVQRELLKWPR